jgi:peptidoglycan/xylan/chitin deacetylase (PgdA/CDA1 family)
MQTHHDLSILRTILLVSFLTLGLMFNGLGMLSLFSIQKVYGTERIKLQPEQGSNNNNSSKVIILAFDDSPKSQFTLAKPLLDKYGLKGTFFTVCTYVDKGSNGTDKGRMSWQDIKTLQSQGHEIESHTMTHGDLNLKSDQNLTYEIGGSKQCLADHGINSTIFAYPASTGSKNATVINTVARYYNLARSGDAPLAFLHCNGYNIQQTGCKLPFDQKGNVTYESRYNVRNWSDRPKPESQQANVIYGNSQMFGQFIREVNLQSNYNKNGCINAIPIVVYHDFIADRNHIYQPNQSFTDVGLFDQEMKYLHDNGFKALMMSDLQYNDSTTFLYIKEPNNALIKNC